MSDEIRTGWLSPSAEFFPCRCYDHLDVANKICAKLKGLSEDESAYISTPDEKLLDMGWMHISIRTFRCHGFAFAVRRTPTLEQFQFLKPYYEGEFGLDMTDDSKQDYEYFAKRF